MSTEYKRRFVLLLLMCLGICKFSFAQTYCHSESNTPFSFLTSPTKLSADSAWDDANYLIPIGFNFLFQGKYYDTLTVNSNGKLYFSDKLGSNEDPTITAFGGATNLVDLVDRALPSTTTSFSPISFKLFENPTDTFLTIEYKNVGFYKDQPTLSDSISFQVKLHRMNGKIEIHIGPHKIIDANSYYTTGPMIGLGSHFGDNGYFLTGDPASPSVAKYISILDATPAEGMHYTFTPVLPNPTLTITSNPLDGCFDPATNYTFTALPINEPLPTLQWEKNGIPLAGEIGLVYNAGLLNKDDSITCVMNLSAACASALPITSNRIVVSKPVASISIVASTDTICDGDSILFSATVSNEGDNPVFKWITNSDTLTTTSPDYMAVGLSDKDTIKCLLISNERCVTNSMVKSDSLVITVLAIATPLVTINAAKDSICEGDSVLYTAIPVFGGSSPLFIWKINGNVMGSDSSSFYATNLTDLDTIQCEMVSSLPCTNGNALSNKHIIKVRTYSQSSVSILANKTTACAGQPIQITATPVNGGSTPIYTWKRNGITSGPSTSVYSATNFNNGDSITCILTPSLFCSTKDTSNFIKLVVNPVLIPQVSIQADKDSICTGQSLFCTATPINGGTPTFQWTLNGTNVGTNSPFFSSTSLNNGDILRCDMSSSLNCLSTPIANSNSIASKVIPYVNAGVSIVTDAPTVCTTTTANFTATPINGGTNPIFQWKKNGVPIGTNSTTYSASGFTNADQISCTLTSNLMCVNGSPKTSNILQLNVLTGPTASISITPSQNPICDGGIVTFAATAIGTSNPVYQWQLNNSNVGINSNTFTASGFANNDAIKCKITNSVDCSGGLPTSNTVNILVNSSANPIITIAPDKINLCDYDTVTYSASVSGAGASPQFEWKKNSVVVGNQQDYTIIQPVNNDIIICTVTSSSNCSAISNTISAIVSTCLSTEEASMKEFGSVYPNPFGEALTIELKTTTATNLILMDLAGKELKREKINSDTEFKTVWNLTEFNAGTYLLKIEGEKENTMRKVVKY